MGDSGFPLLFDAGQIRYVHLTSVRRNIGPIILGATQSSIDERGYFLKVFFPGLFVPELLCAAPAGTEPNLPTCLDVAG